MNAQERLKLHKWQVELLTKTYGDTKVANSPTSSPYSTDWRFDDGTDNPEDYRGQPVYGTEEGGQTFFDFPFVKIQGNDQNVASTPQQHRQYPNTLFYNRPKELDGVNPYIIDQFIKDKAKELFKFNTGIPLAHQDGGGFEHWDAEVKTDFLKKHDKEFQQWLKENKMNIEDQPDSKNQTNSLKIG